jgi:hypothetical protein
MGVVGSVPQEMSDGEMPAWLVGFVIGVGSALECRSIDMGVDGATGQEIRLIEFAVFVQQVRIPFVLPAYLHRESSASGVLERDQGVIPLVGNGPSVTRQAFGLVLDGHGPMEAQDGLPQGYGDRMKTSPDFVIENFEALGALD